MIFDYEVSRFIDQKLVRDTIRFDNFKYLNNELKKSAEMDKFYFVLLPAKRRFFSHSGACIILQLKRTWLRTVCLFESYFLSITASVDINISDLTQCQTLLCSFNHSLPYTKCFIYNCSNYPLEFPFIYCCGV